MRIQLPPLPKTGTIKHHILFSHPDPAVEQALDLLLNMENDPECTPSQYRDSEARYDRAYQRAAERVSMALKRESARVRIQPSNQKRQCEISRSRARDSHRRATPTKSTSAESDGESSSGDPDPDPPRTSLVGFSPVSLTPGHLESPALHDSLKLLLGDSAEILASLDPSSLDGVVTDPPHQILKQAWDVLPKVDLWRSVFRVLRHGAPLIAIGSPKTYHRMATAIEDAGFAIEDMATWAFATGKPPSLRRLKRAHAPILIARKPGPKLPINIDEGRLPYVDDADREQTKKTNMLRTQARRRSGVYDPSLDTSPSGLAPFVPKSGRWPSNLIIIEPCLGRHDRFFLIPVVRDHKGHPAAKPIQLLAHLIRIFIPPGGSVLDPFAGGGSTGIAAIATGRRALLIERERGFYDMAKKNLARARRGNYHFAEIPAHSEDMTDLSAAVRNCVNTSDNEDLHATPERATLLGPDGLLTSRDMAKRLGISSRTLRRRVREEGWPCVRVGPKALRFDPEKVLEVILQN